ncbi:MAG TPA: LEA type 2 family protein [Thermoanaerobaculia bacterium]|nr:LEA type 2 family protein [Thermoanaerobaculia bacterium]
MRVLALVLMLLQSTAPPSSLSVRILDEQKARVTISGTGSDMPAGPFQGDVTVNGSDSKLPVMGTVTRNGAHWSLPIEVKFASIPADWAERVRLDAFTCRLQGKVGDTAKEWSESGTWKEIEVDAGDTQEKFVSLKDVQLTEMTLTSSEAQAQVAIRNPFSFPLRIAETEYTLFAEGQEVGSGGTHGMILHPTQNNVLSLPIEIDHAALLSAAGKALLSGGDVRVTLEGRLVLRLKGGDLPVPLHLTGRLSGA